MSYDKFKVGDRVRACGVFKGGEWLTGELVSAHVSGAGPGSFHFRADDGRDGRVVHCSAHRLMLVDEWQATRCCETCGTVDVETWHIDTKIPNGFNARMCAPCMVQHIVSLELQLA